MRELSSLAQLFLRHPDTEQDKIFYNKENNDRSYQDTNYVRSHYTGRVRTQVEESVSIKALRVECNIGQCKVQGQQNDNWDDVENRYRLSPREEDLEEGVGRVKRMLRSIGP